jgi:hypothetical protein
VKFEPHDAVLSDLEINLWRKSPVDFFTPNGHAGMAE